MKYVAFRDEFSYNWAVSKMLKTKYIRAFDLAVLLPEASPPEVANRKKEKLLGVSLLAREALSNPARLSVDIETARQVGQLAARLTSKLNVKLVFFSLCTNKCYDDRVMARAFAEAFPEGQVELFEHNGDPVRTFAKLSFCSHMMSMRLHGAIMAFTANVPFLQLEYHPKCRDFAQTIGLAESHRLDMKEFSCDRLTKKLEALMRIDSISSVMSLRSAQEQCRLNFCASML
jgi:polysaccharide pyruvyl transferase WcaK-like protein